MEENQANKLRVRTGRGYCSIAMQIDINKYEEQKKLSTENVRYEKFGNVVIITKKKLKNSLDFKNINLFFFCLI
ncbi:MAG: hypothetical protein H0U73_05590 [Tatlockia sp.]|nr:hypothetical protein [Tatlockia sp.]